MPKMIQSKSLSLEVCYNKYIVFILKVCTVDAKWAKMVGKAELLIYICKFKKQGVSKMFWLGYV